MHWAVPPVDTGFLGGRTTATSTTTVQSLLPHAPMPRRPDRVVEQRLLADASRAAFAPLVQFRWPGHSRCWRFGMALSSLPMRDRRWPLRFRRCAPARLPLRLAVENSD